MYKYKRKCEFAIFLSDIINMWDTYLHVVVNNTHIPDISYQKLLVNICLIILTV